MCSVLEGVAFATVLSGIRRALVDGERAFEITSRLIMCFLRHLSAESAFDTLEQGLSYREHILAVGLDSYEVGHPPSQFVNVFERARQHDFLTMHAIQAAFLPAVKKQALLAQAVAIYHQEIAA